MVNHFILPEAETRIARLQRRVRDLCQQGRMDERAAAEVITELDDIDTDQFNAQVAHIADFADQLDASGTRTVIE